MQLTNKVAPNLDTKHNKTKKRRTFLKVHIHRKLFRVHIHRKHYDQENVFPSWREMRGLTHLNIYRYPSEVSFHASLFPLLRSLPQLPFF